MSYLSTQLDRGVLSKESCQGNNCLRFGRLPDKVKTLKYQFDSTWPASSMKTKEKWVEGTAALTSLPAVTRVVTTTLYCIRRGKAG